MVNKKFTYLELLYGKVHKVSHKEPDMFGTYDPPQERCVVCGLYPESDWPVKCNICGRVVCGPCADTYTDRNGVEHDRCKKCKVKYHGSTDTMCHVCGIRITIESPQIKCHRCGRIVCIRCSSDYEDTRCTVVLCKTCQDSEGLNVGQCQESEKCKTCKWIIASGDGLVFCNKENRQLYPTAIGLSHDELYFAENEDEPSCKKFKPKDTCDNKKPEVKTVYALDFKRKVDKE